MPRVISGSAGGLILKAPEGQRTRPTADRTKEALFSALSARLSWSGLNVLELYAGSGQLGIEALSRGAGRAVFVEQNRRTAALIRDNLSYCGFLERSELVVADALRALDVLVAEGRCFDLILADPPYEEAHFAFVEIAERLCAAPLLAPDGLFVLESAAHPPQSPQISTLALKKSCQYGSAMVSFYGHLNEAEPASC